MVVWKQARQKFLGRYAYYLKIVLFLFNKILNDILICIIDCKLEISKVIRLDHKVWYLEPNFVASLGLNQFCKRSAGPVKRIWLKSVSVYIMAQWHFWTKLFSYHISQHTSPIAELLCVKNGRAIVVCAFLMKWLKKYILKVWKKL